MENLIKELRNLMDFKPTTEPGDVVLIAAKDPQLFLYAMVTDIERDTSRKDEWWQVHLAVLSLPMQQMVWTLRTPQMTGQEIFTMGGEDRFVQAVAFPAPKSPEPAAKKSEKQQKIVPLKRVK